ncbi:MAG: DUF2959 domain-containing protein [Sumerlaeia bacterium]
MNRQNALLALLIFPLIFSATACNKMYYGMMEDLGTPKRDILVSRVEKAQVDQQEAKEQFQTALEKFTAVVNFDGGDLENRYSSLNREYERSKTAANDVSDRINQIEDVAKELFREWERELDQYSSASLRASSQRTLQRTQDRYDDLMVALRDSEKRMQPVLNAFGDQVLFLKHNLNAQAIASIQNEVGALENEVGRLIAEMNKSIEAADAFLAEMGLQE